MSGCDCIALAARVCVQPSFSLSRAAAAHAEEAPTPEEAIAAHPASEADPIATGELAQPENGTASQAGEAANTDPVEG